MSTFIAIVQSLIRLSLHLYMSSLSLKQVFSLIKPQILQFLVDILIHQNVNEPF